MYKFLISTLILTVFIQLTDCQDSLLKPYNPDADAKSQLLQAIEQAKKSEKHLLIMVGGNWCKWCLRLNSFIEQHESIDSIVRTDYIFLHINYSKDNQNQDVMAQLEYPQRFGFPVLVILDTSGKRIHTQNTAYLENGDSYDEKIIEEFLLDWNYKALHPIE